MLRKKNSSSASICSNRHNDKCINVPTKEFHDFMEKPGFMSKVNHITKFLLIDLDNCGVDNA